MSKSLDELEKEISLMRELRDQYFILNSKANEEEMRNDILKRTLLLYEDCMEMKEECEGVRNLFGGMVLNINEDYDQRCEEALSIAVKLVPSDYRGWNELAQCISKRGDDPDLVRQLMTMSVSIYPCALSLALLSFSIRGTLSSLNAIEAANARKESLSLARQSISMDDTCGDAWLSLANSLLSAFFFDGQKTTSHLDESIVCYEKAMSNGLLHNSDLYLNLSTALRYRCHMDKSLQYLEKAYQCERSDRVKEQLTQFTLIIRKMERAVNSIKSNKCVKEDEEVKRERDNMAGVVVEVVSPQSFTPCIIVMKDNTDNSPFVLALFNCSSSLSLLVGDILSIRSPQILEYDQIALLRVISPLNVLRNGKSLRDVSIALASVSIHIPSTSSTSISSRNTAKC